MRHSQVFLAQDMAFSSHLLAPVISYMPMLHLSHITSVCVSKWDRTLNFRHLYLNVLQAHHSQTISNRTCHFPWKNDFSSKLEVEVHSCLLLHSLSPQIYQWILLALLANFYLAHVLLGSCDYWCWPAPDPSHCPVDASSTRTLSQSLREGDTNYTPGPVIPCLNPSELCRDSPRARGSKPGVPLSSLLVPPKAAFHPPQPETSLIHLPTRLLA